jgi:hypothetical protein
MMLEVNRWTAYANHNERVLTFNDVFKSQPAARLNGRRQKKSGPHLEGRDQRF